MNDFLWKLPPFKHQEERFHLYRDKEYHAHLWEQRTGKSCITIATAAWLNIQGKINGLLVIAPNGVHLNWTRNEIPLHMPDYVGCKSVAWSCHPHAEDRKALENFQKKPHSGLKALSVNIESFRSEKTLDYVNWFLRSHRCLIVVDEGSTIKNISAQQTKHVLNLRKLAPYRRLLNGTPLTQSPLDIYPQLTWLDEEIFGTSHVAFRNRYAIVEHQGRMKREIKKLLESIAGRFDSYPWGDMEHSEIRGFVEAGSQPLADDRPPIEFTVKQTGRMTYTMAWKCGKVYGTEKMIFQAGDVYPVITGYRYLDELKAKIAPHSDRVLKSDCLDLPDKIYGKRYVELSTQQDRMYRELKKECITQCEGREMSAALAITKMLRCQQIVGGFFVPDNASIEVDPDEEVIAKRLDNRATPIPGPNPKLEALLVDIENGLAGKGIVWARFTAEIRLIASALRQKFGREAVAELYGEIPSDIRQASIGSFQTAEFPHILVANPACKGVSRGQNLCKADWEWFYSNSFSLEDRLQAEDRPHSPGIQNNLAVIDCIASGTLDDKVVDALREKKNLADQVTGDRLREWI